MPLNIVDFHCHFIGPSFPLTTLVGLPPAQRAAWEGINRHLADEHGLVASIETSGLTARVINAPLQFLQDADGEVPPDVIPRLNDMIAEVVRRHPGRLYGLATVDGFSGDAGARELIRAVKELGLRGVLFESAKGDLLPDAREARPILAAAAALGVPVFLHPVADPQLFARFKRFGGLGMRLTRATINAAALFAMLEGGVFDELPNLRVVVITLTLGGLLLAEGVGQGSGMRSDAPALARRHVYIDTMGLDTVAIRTAVELIGADHVLMGTDWPIAVEKAVPERLSVALAHLTPAEQQMIAGGTALKLLGVA
jgi:aminocarboxymuconate-semialdehyde decarboxylase